MRQLQQAIDPRERFVPALSLRRRLEYFVDRFKLSRPQRGSDDLDDYVAFLLETEGQPFLLLRYARYPEDMVDVFIPAHMAGSTPFMNRIVNELEVTKEDVTRVR